MTADRTTQLQLWLDQLQAGHDEAQERLIEAAAARLRTLAHHMLIGDRVRLWEETDDVLQDALVQLHKALSSIRPESSRDFLHIAALHIRRTILTMARRYFGPQGHAANMVAPGAAMSALHGSGHALIDESTPSKIVGHKEQWLRMQEAVDLLPDDLQEVTELLWIHGLSQIEVARLLDISDRTVRRRWQRARLQLANALSAESAGNGSYRENGRDVE